MYNLIPKETCIAKWKKLPAKKTNSKSKKNMTVKDKGLLLFLFDWFWKGFCQLSNFHYFFFSWLIFNHMHKCIQAKTFETQVCWSPDSCTHYWHHSSPHCSYNDTEKVKKNIIWYNNATIPCLSLIIWKVFYSTCMWNMTPDETLCVQVFKNR